MSEVNDQEQVWEEGDAIVELMHESTMELIDKYEIKARTIDVPDNYVSGVGEVIIAFSNLKMNLALFLSTVVGADNSKEGIERRQFIFGLPFSEVVQSLWTWAHSSGFDKSDDLLAALHLAEAAEVARDEIIDSTYFAAHRKMMPFAGDTGDRGSYELESLSDVAMQIQRVTALTQYFYERVIGVPRSSS